MEVQKYLCWNENKPTYGWCTYQAIDNRTNVQQIIYFACLWVFAFVIVRYLVILRKLCERRAYRKLFGDMYFYIFYVMLIWVVSSIVKVAINIAIYYTYIRPEQIKQTSSTNNNQAFTSSPSQDLDVDYQSSEPIVILASVFGFLQVISAFCVLLLILMIPYNWLNMILLHTRDQQSLSFEMRVSIRRYFRVLTFIKYYMLVVRNLFVVFLIVQPFLLFFTKFGCELNLNRINALIITTQSFLIVFFYLFGYFVAKKMQKNNLILITSHDKKRIYCQYFILLVVLFIRVVLNTVLKIYSINDRRQPTKNCYQKDDYMKQKILAYEILAKSIMHMLPIAVVILIYRPTIEIRKRYERILRDRQSWDSDSLIIEYAGGSQSSETGQSNKINETVQHDNIHKAAGITKKGQGSGKGGGDGDRKNSQNINKKI